MSEQNYDIYPEMANFSVLLPYCTQELGHEHSKGEGINVGQKKEMYPNAITSK